MPRLFQVERELLLALRGELKLAASSAAIRVIYPGRYAWCISTNGFPQGKSRHQMVVDAPESLHDAKIIDRGLKISVFGCIASRKI
jgi:hypothetical protein